MGTTHTRQVLPGNPSPDIQTRKPAVAFQTNNVPPSQYVYLQDNDWIVLTTFCTLNTQTLRVTYRYLTPQGEIKEGTFNPGTLIGNGFQQFTFQIGEGWLLSIALQQTTLSLSGNWMWTQLGITRSNIGTLIEQGHIWEGYVYFNVPTGWPGVQPKEITDGAGTVVSITGSAPAAGADITEVIPSNRRRQLLSFQATLVSSAAVANRTPIFLIDDGAQVLYDSPATFTQTASQSVVYSAGSSVPSQAPLTLFAILQLPIPTIVKSGWRIRTFTAGLQAGDQWSAPRYAVLEWGTIDV